MYQLNDTHSSKFFAQKYEKVKFQQHCHLHFSAQGIFLFWSHLLIPFLHGQCIFFVLKRVKVCHSLTHSYYLLRDNSSTVRAMHCYTINHFNWKSERYRSLLHQLTASRLSH
jgi:hypothetical protein